MNEALGTGLPPMSPPPSLHAFIAAHLDEAGRLQDSSMPLPDETPAPDGGVRWMAGAMDGVLGHHAGSDVSDERAQRVAAAVAEAATRRTTRRRLRRLYDLLREDDVLGFVDAMVQHLVELQPDRARVHELGRWLATTASDRGPVKVGLALLGVTGLADDVGVVRTLGAHDEFTLFAAAALRNGLDDPDSELWSLAAAVDGWGRIQCVERLRDTRDPAIRSWILRQGFRNSVMEEYLAYIAATTGGLVEALRAPDPDRELLSAAGAILGALIAGGPAEDIHDYDEGADAVELFLIHLTDRAETLADFLAVQAVRSFLAEQEDWDDLDSRGWSVTRREAFEQRCEQILGREMWIARIHQGLASDDGVEFWQAQQAARHRGVDIFDLQLQRLREDPVGGPWFQAWQGADRGRAEALAALAVEVLPLDEIATGPDTALGLGVEWSLHSALDWSLQALRDHPGVGAPLLLAALRSPVIRNRNMTLNALRSWPRDRWPDGVEGLVRQVAASDPDPRVREHAAEVLAG
jgi:hypothetical protein